MVMRRYCTFLIVLVLLSSSALAHAGEYNGSAHEALSKSSLLIASLASIVIILCISITALKKKKSSSFKLLMFAFIVLTAVATTAYLSISTILLNVRSESHGPVHWHADYEIWKCGEHLEFSESTGLSNRRGTPVFHGHNDQRIHVEGVVTTFDDVQFKNFFSVMGGKLSDDGFELPTATGVVTARSGERCPLGEGKLQAFLYRVTNPDPSKNKGFFYTQTKLDDVEDYVPAPYSLVPPGDCLILEFDAEKGKTERLCETYKVARDKGLITEVENGG